MKIAIIIPSRYQSKRFPGKPLHKIAGTSMVRRVINVAFSAIKQHKNVRIILATDDERIVEEVKDLKDLTISMTSEAATGSDRVFQAMKNLNLDVDYIINFQGDAPLTPPNLLSSMVERLQESQAKIEVLTPYVRLSWNQLDDLYESKKLSNSNSGTSLIKNQNDEAVWFSKSIIPNIRKENREEKYSPVLRHIGVYAFRKDILEKFVNWTGSYYENLEELEQLRILENGHKISVFDATSMGENLHAGIDRIEDAIKAEEFLLKNGEIA